MAEQNLEGFYDNPYKFNAKELDNEAGNPTAWGATGHVDLVGNKDGSYQMAGNGDAILSYLKTLGTEEDRVWSLSGTVPQTPKPKQEQQPQHNNDRWSLEEIRELWNRLWD